MHTRRDLIVWLILLAGLVGCASIATSNRTTTSANGPAPTPTATLSPLGQQAADRMKKLTFTPQGICQFTPEEGQQFDLTIAQAFADLLRAPEAKSLGHREIETLFVGAMVALRPYPPTQGEIRILDEVNGYLLVHLPLAYCQRSSHDYHVPGLYVFSRTGQSWLLAQSYLVNARWIEDRWVGFTTFGSGYSLPTYKLAHVYQSGGRWLLQDVSKVRFGPRLVWEDVPDQKREIISFSEGYRQIVIIGGGFAPGNPAPCDFGNNLSKLKPQRTCTGCNSSNFLNAFYNGTFTLQWNGSEYVLTDKTPYTVRVILADYTSLEDQPPTAEALARDSYHILRSESWRTFCTAQPRQAER